MTIIWLSTLLMPTEYVYKYTFQMEWPSPGSTGPRTYQQGWHCWIDLIDMTQLLRLWLAFWYSMNPFLSHSSVIKFSLKSIPFLPCTSHKWDRKEEDIWENLHGRDKQRRSGLKTPPILSMTLRNQFITLFKSWIYIPA